MDELTPYTQGWETFKEGASYKAISSIMVRNGMIAHEAEAMLKMIFEGGYNACKPNQGLYKQEKERKKKER